MVNFTYYIFYICEKNNEKHIDRKKQDNIYSDDLEYSYADGMTSDPPATMVDVRVYEFQGWEYDKNGKNIIAVYMPQYRQDLIVTRRIIDRKKG